MFNSRLSVRAGRGCRTSVSFGSSFVLRLTIAVAFCAFASIASAKPTLNMVANAFAGRSPVVAPAGLANVLGSNLGDVSAAYVNGVSARFKVSNPNQLLLLVPAETVLGSAVVTVEDASGKDSVAVWVEQYDPAIAGDNNQACCAAYALHADSSLITPVNPARKGEAITIFVTGAGRDSSTPLTVEVGRQAVRPSRVTPWSWFSDADGPLYGMYAVTFTLPMSWAERDVAVLAGGTFSDQRKLPLETAPLRPAEIVVDFQTSAPTKSMSGLLMGGDVGKPPVDRISPLEPRLYRAGNWSYLWAGNGASWPQLYALFRGLGARVELILGDTWNNGGYNIAPFPFEDWAKWEAHVRKIARDNKSRDLLWDVWNEPDLTWGAGTREQFFEAYRRAYKVLREELGPSVLIGGPSLGTGGKSWGESKGFIVGLLDYCHRHGCEVNFISWHSLEDTNNGIPALADRLMDFRRSTLDNPSYAALNIQEIHINEIVGPARSEDSGAILGYFYYLEKGGADAAARACWPDSLETFPFEPAANQVQNGTLDGLLTRNSFQPRAAWWTNTYYAPRTGARVPATTSIASSCQSRRRFPTAGTRLANPAGLLQLRTAAVRLAGHFDVEGAERPEQGGAARGTDSSNRRSTAAFADLGGPD